MQQWIDVTARVKTHADLKRGDLFVGEHRALQLRKTRIHPDVPFKYDGLSVLRRWDRCDPRPYTVELEYDDGSFWRGFVEVSVAPTTLEIEIGRAIEAARRQCAEDNNWGSVEHLQTLEVRCVMRGHIEQEELP